MTMPEETILIATANLLRTEAVKRLESCRSRIAGDEEPEAALASIGHDLSIAVLASKTADGIDEFLREVGAEQIREALDGD